MITGAKINNLLTGNHKFLKILKHFSHFSLNAKELGHCHKKQLAQNSCH
jgi:hypothetical protein